jgi:hypothetical protein
VDVPAQLAADHRELSERRVDQLRPQVRIAVQREAEDRHEQQEQGEQRQEPVVGDQRGQVRALVVAELVEHGKREAQPTVTPLVGVYRGDGTTRHDT